MIKLGFEVCENDLAKISKKLQAWGSLEDQDPQHLPGSPFYWGCLALPPFPSKEELDWLIWIWSSSHPEDGEAFQWAG